VHLEEPVNGIQPVEVVAEGALARASLRGHVFAAVGYGLNAVNGSLLSPERASRGTACGAYRLRLSCR